MKLTTTFSVFLIPTLLIGCSKAGPEQQAAEIHLEKDQVVLDATSPQAASISTEPARPAGTTKLLLNGRLVWDDNATTRLFSPLSGRVTKIFVEAGQRVKAGEPLALLASPDYGQAQADARKAAGDLHLAQKTLTRIRDLYEHGAAALKDLQSAEADVEKAELEEHRANIRLSLYGGAISGVDQAYVFKSPIDGIVVEKNINPGAEIRADQMLANTPQLAAPLFVITDPARLWIQIDVPERDQAKLKVSQPFLVRNLSLPDETFPGQIEVISDSLDPATRTLKARGSLANPNRRLKAEMFVKAELELKPLNGVEIPTQALFLRGERHCVLVESSPSHFARREVETGPEQGGRILITQGLTAGEKVVTQGAMLLEQVITSTEKL